MRRLSSLGLLLATSITVAACATLFSSTGPKQRIKAPHAVHLKAEVDCLACHEPIFDSKELANMEVFPEEKKCLECHKKEKKEGKCEFCHIGEPATYDKRVTHLTFDHAKHLAKDEDCSKCHEVGEKNGPKQISKPSMETCTGCHEGKHDEMFAASKCDVCHKDLTTFPLKPLTALSHKGDYVKRHGRDAKAGGTCMTCHEQSFCADCHSKTVPMRLELLVPERVDRGFVHPNDFLGRHPVEARADQSTCLKCHDTASCESCHTARGVSSVNPLRNPHGDGYAVGGRHGQDARRDIASCAVCHEQGAQTMCVDCHRVGGVGGNPHPDSWLKRHGREEIDANATCMVCHR